MIIAKAPLVHYRIILLAKKLALTTCPMSVILPLPDFTFLAHSAPSQLAAIAITPRHR